MSSFICFAPLFPCKGPMEPQTHHYGGNSFRGAPFWVPVGGLGDQSKLIVFLFRFEEPFSACPRPNHRVGLSQNRKPRGMALKGTLRNQSVKKSQNCRHTQGVPQMNMDRILHFAHCHRKVKPKGRYQEDRFHFERLGCTTLPTASPKQEPHITRSNT